ncbi:MAG: DUF3566 domain-containing protein [Candidatus Ancillula sp.]|jgi:hypothetical protein|nr:DUF3566 domain-containing protein [Candidatus Ancillula sp.]
MATTKKTGSKGTRRTAGSTGAFPIVENSIRKDGSKRAGSGSAGVANLVKRANESEKTASKSKSSSKSLPKAMPKTGKKMPAALTRLKAKTSLNPDTYVMTIDRIDPKSTAKVVFFLSLAIGIIFTIAITLFWLMLDVSGVIFQVVQAVIGSGFGVDLSNAFSVGKVFLFVAIFSLIGVIIWTLLAFIFAAIYNQAAKIVGGIKFHLSKSE